MVPFLDTNTFTRILDESGCSRTQEQRLPSSHWVKYISKCQRYHCWIDLFNDSISKPTVEHHLSRLCLGDLADHLPYVEYSPPPAIDDIE